MKKEGGERLVVRLVGDGDGGILVGAGLEELVDGQHFSWGEANKARFC